MAFDITPYINMKPSEVRKLIREGVIDFPTAGMCRGYAQANLIILPPEYAGDFEEFARRNPFPCPILEIVRGTPETHDMGEGGNICTDIPKYRIYRDGKWDGKELTDVSGYWKEGYVGFLIGCSFSFEEALMREGIEVRHIAQGRNVPMFKTNIVLQLLSYVAQTEREFIHQRQAEGIAAAKARGVKFGRPYKELPAGFQEVKARWERGELSARAAGKELHIAHSTFLYWVRGNIC